MFNSRLSLFVPFVFLLAFAAPVFAYTSPGEPTGYVNDFAGVMSADAKANLEAELTQFHKDTGGDIAVAIVPSLGGDDIESYSNTLFREWGVGNKDNNTGILLVVAIEDREMRIEVGYGYEGVVPDLYASRIINNVITPKFKYRDYDGGITDGVASLIALAKDPNAAPPEEAGTPPLPAFSYAFLYILVTSFLLVTRILASTKSWWLGGVLGGIVSVAFYFIFGLTVALVSALPLIGLGLLFDYVVSKAYTNSKTNGIPPPWWMGGGGRWGGGGGFGGFGGGSSGGGGASGRW